VAYIEEKVFTTALAIVQRLQQHGFIAYFVGGYARDILLKLPSCDIDIATDASVEEITLLFKKCHLVGANFGVVQVVSERIAFEVATFRKDVGSDGRRPDHIVRATPQEDAFRRDFTINGMFYDPIHKKIIDYVNGKEDIKKKIVRFIGDPLERIEEDRLRMIRAVRFAIRLGCTLEKNSYQAIYQKKETLFPSVSMERIQEELKKMAAFGSFAKSILLLQEVGLLQQIFPKCLPKGLQKLEKLSCHIPLSVQLVVLFDWSCDEIDEELRRLKMSNDAIALAKDFFSWRQLLQGPLDEIAFVHLLAKKHGHICKQALFALCDKPVIKKLQKKEEELQSFVDRIHDNDPLIRAQDLQEMGIKPSSLMGELLRLAEELAIQKKLHSKTEVLLLLEKSSLWPKI